jgi:hypothetical protein
MRTDVWAAANAETTASEIANMIGLILHENARECTLGDEQRSESCVRIR